MENNLNVTGLACPKPLLLTKKTLADLPAGAQLTVHLDDAQSIEDISYFCEAAGHTLVSYKQLEDGYYELLIEKRAL